MRFNDKKVIDMDFASLYPAPMASKTVEFEELLKIFHEKRMWVKRIKERRIKLEKILNKIS